jgi:dihydroceramidase
VYGIPSILSTGNHTSADHLSIFQKADELSMHLAIGTLLHQLFTFQEPPHIQRRNAAIILGVLVPFVIYHCVADEFLLHIVLFFCMSWIVAFKTRSIIATRIQEKEHRDKIRKLVSLATWSAIIAYAIWNVDVHFCPQVIGAKRMVGFPASILLELHGYWHIMTGISAYTFMAIIEFLLSPQDIESHGVGFAWPAKAVLHDIIPTSKPTSNGLANGHKVNGHQANGHVKSEKH